MNFQKSQAYQRRHYGIGIPMEKAKKLVQKLIQEEASDGKGNKSNVDT